jgi:hypothetical protein
MTSPPISPFGVGHCVVAVRAAYHTHPRADVSVQLHTSLAASTPLVLGRVSRHRCDAPPPPVSALQQTNACGGRTS